MRIGFNLLGKKVVVDYGFKEPDFISKEDVKHYTNVEQLSVELRRLHRKIKKYSKIFGHTEFYTRGLSEEDIAVLRRRGFNVTLRSKTLRNGKVKLVRDQFRITI